jgi:hypothetical protein
MTVQTQHEPDRSTGPETRAKPATTAPREYRLNDLAGDPLGTIAAPAGRLVVGSAAPTIYLRRSL